jgi:hypothetical protein
MPSKSFTDSGAVWIDVFEEIRYAGKNPPR